MAGVKKINIRQGHATRMWRNMNWKLALFLETVRLPSSSLCSIRIALNSWFSYLYLGGWGWGWNYRYAPPWPVYAILGTGPRASGILGKHTISHLSIVYSLNLTFK